MKLVLLLFFALLLPAVADRESDWAAIRQLEAEEAPNIEGASAQEVIQSALRFLERKESALKGFISRYPGDPRTLDARIRLSHVLANRAALTGQEALYAEALVHLNAGGEPSTLERRADLAFARIVLAMRRSSLVPGESERATLTAQLQSFERQHAADRRLAALKAEIATLYDAAPRQKRALLTQALAATSNPDLQARIHDDLRRLDLLGQPVTLSGPTDAGAKVDTSTYKGELVVIVYFAGWSVPSLVALQEMGELARRLPAKGVRFVGVSLDEKPETLAAMIAPLKLNWPIVRDGQGWQSPLVRSFGINALPTVWVLDKKGHLRTLNARYDAEATLRRLLRE